MRQDKLASPRQTSFLESLLLGDEIEPASTALIETTALTPIESSTPSSLPPTTAEMADLFGFIAQLEKVSPDKINSRVQDTERADNLADVDENEEIENEEKESDESRSSLPCITPQWLLEHHPDLLARIAATCNSMCEFEKLNPQESAKQVVASQVVHRLRGMQTESEIESELFECCCALERLTTRLYGDVANSRDEVAHYVDTLIENARHQPYENEEEWIRQAFEVAVRKCLADESKPIYTMLIVSTLLRPFREVVRRLLLANEIPFPERVLAQVRESDYAKMMRESLQTLARLGITAQTTTLVWQVARSGESKKTSALWLARRVDGAIAAIWEGYAIVEQHVVRALGYALLATFAADKHITHQITIAEDDIERVKQTLLAQGYRCGESAYPQDDRVVKLWCEFCRGRDGGWWFGDEAGRVMVVIPYLMRRRLSYHKPLCRAVSRMQAWGYRFYYDDNTLYFLPSGVELPGEAFRNGNVAGHEGGA